MTADFSPLNDEETLLALIDVARRAFEKGREAQDADLLQQSINLIVSLERRLDAIRRAQRGPTV